MCQRKGAPLKGRDRLQPVFGASGALGSGRPALVSCPGQPLVELWPWGWTPGPPLPACSLLGAALSALGSAGVVPNKASKAHGHSCVTVIHGHHGYLFSGRPVGQAQAADVGLLEEKSQKASAVLHKCPGQIHQPLPRSQPGTDEDMGRQHEDMGQEAPPSLILN